MVFSYKNRIIHSPATCESSARDESAAAQVQTITGARVCYCGNLILREYYLGFEKHSQAAEITPLICCVRRGGIEDSLFSPIQIKRLVQLRTRSLASHDRQKLVCACGCVVSLYPGKEIEVKNGGCEKWS